MEDFDLNMDIKPTDWIPENSMIKVIGVGGGGCNAVTYMYNRQIKGCSFIVCNTDAQALRKSNVPIKVQLGEGLGAGTNPVKGRNCALASQDEIASKVLDCGTKMLFITAGMGGGTGTGAAPVIAKMAKDKGILTVGVVTLPVKSEKNGSYSKALDGVRDMADNVDSLLIIDNEKLAEIYSDQLLKDAFPKSDEVLATAVSGITEIISKPGYINVDFEDVKNMMKGSGMALMGCGSGRGENRLQEAVSGALDSPLLYKLDLTTAKHALVNITTGSGEDGLRMCDLTTINELIAGKIGNANKFKQGIVYDDNPERGDEVSITVIATGFKMSIIDEIVGQPGGNIIVIDRDYKYESGIDNLEEVYDQKIIKVAIGNPTRTFHYEEKPALCITPRDEFSPLENIASITRRR
ncbi:MAG: cell division protein FtsZ [Bacteroidales bacterium]|nr:cell division protein FtsZ [Bacteroidales bacterium]